jgi:glycosyltransferase involved in cell wall biosynthesis
VSPDKIHVVGHAPVPAAETPAGDYFGSGSPVVLFLGQKYAYKGLKQLLQAMPRVWRTRPEVRFAYLGPRTAYSRKLFRNLSDPRVIEKDRVPESEKNSALASCAVFCLPSRQESFGGVFVEAWAQGKPVVGGNIPAVAELITPGKDGALVDESPKNLAQVLLDLLQDPERSRRLGAAGRERVKQHHTWEAVVARVERVYQSLTEHQR